MPLSADRPSVSSFDFLPTCRPIEFSRRIWLTLTFLLSVGHIRLVKNFLLFFFFHNWHYELLNKVHVAATILSSASDFLFIEFKEMPSSSFVKRLFSPFSFLYTSIWNKKASILRFFQLQVCLQQILYLCREKNEIFSAFLHFVWNYSTIHFIIFI